VCLGLRKFHSFMGGGGGGKFHSFMGDDGGDQGLRPPLIRSSVCVRAADGVGESWAAIAASGERMGRGQMRAKGRFFPFRVDCGKGCSMPDLQGYFGQSNNVEAKWLYQLRTNSKEPIVKKIPHKT
jgi:hypothetical protein